MEPAHTDDAYLWTISESCHHFLKLVTGSEEERTIDFVYLYALRNRVVLQVGREEVELLVQVNLIICDGCHVGGFAHSLHEEQAGDNQTYLDSHGQVRR